MNAPVRIIALDLPSHAESYNVDAGKFRTLKNAAVEKIIAYDEKYGHYLLEHLNRTSRNLREFMLFSGYDEKFSEKISAASWFHDLGKLRQPASLWKHTEEKPSEDKKAIRAEHTLLGKYALYDLMDENGLSPDKDDDSHIKTIVFFMEAHHERVNGSGPLGMDGARMGEILQMLTIIDEVDGKIKLKHENHSDIFNDLNGRHAAKFDPCLVERYENFCSKNNVLADLKQLREAALQPLPR